MNLNAFDLNLIRVFDALLKERSVTRAGKRIGLSQPAVSSALNRLRAAFGDELFIRSGHHMVPTPRAIGMAEAVGSAMRALELAFERYSEMDPAKLQRSYTLMGADFFSMLFMPRLSSIIASAAPSVRLRLLDSARGDIATLLQDGVIDLALEHLPATPNWVMSAPLFRSCFVVVTGANNPVLRDLRLAEGDVMPLTAFSELGFAVYSLDGGETGCAVETLRVFDLAHRAVIALPHFQATALAAADGDLAALLPCQFAEAIAPRLGLKVYRVPIEMPVLEIGMYWHARANDDLQHKWLRDRVAETVDVLQFDRHAERYLAHGERFDPRLKPLVA